MNPKPRPNHYQYLATLRSMTDEQRLLSAFELSEFSRQVFKAGLRDRCPDKTEDELHSLFLKRLERVTTGIGNRCSLDLSPGSHRLK